MTPHNNTFLLLANLISAPRAPGQLAQSFSSQVNLNIIKLTDKFDFQEDSTETRKLWWNPKGVKPRGCDQFPQAGPGGAAANYLRCVTMSVWGCHSLLDSLNNTLDRLNTPAGQTQTNFHSVKVRLVRH